MSTGGVSGTRGGLGLPRKVNLALSSAAREPSGASCVETLDVHDDDLARLHLAEQGLLRELVLDLALDRAAHRVPELGYGV
jgi:hypothetical protein